MINLVSEERQGSVFIAMAIKYSAAEKEIIFLKAITDLIDSMVNREVFQIAGDSVDTNIYFHSYTHKQFFNVLLVDLLSKSDKVLIGEETAYLDALTHICSNPSFNIKGSVASLRGAVGSFRTWLDQEPTVNIWLPTLDSEVDLKMPRKTFMRICGNLSKHSILRQSYPARDVQKLLARAGKTVSISEATLALEQFYERFHGDIFGYHASTIAEFLNEIRWGVHEYLSPEYDRSYTPKGGNPPGYRFKYPDTVNDVLARSLYWSLMNNVRSGPIFQRFSVTKYLKMRY